MRMRAWLALAALLPWHECCAQHWSGLAGVATDSTVRGISRTAGQPVLQAGVAYAGSEGIVAGAWGATTLRASHPASETELNPYLGWSGRLAADWDGRALLSHYGFAGQATYQEDYDEAAVSVTYRNALRMTLAVSPDTSLQSRYGAVARGVVAAADLAGRMQILHAVYADAGVGYADLDLIHTGYGYWNAGVDARLAALRLELSYIGTSPAASRIYRGLAGSRWLASALLAF